MSKPFLGVKDGQLAACPDSPNCVSTQAQNPDKRMEPLPFIDNLSVTRDQIISIVQQMNRTTIEDDSEKYVHVIVTSKLLRFKDDVEFYLDDANGLVHFRSASRTGYSDFGVNRKRMEEMSVEYQKRYDEVMS